MNSRTLRKIKEICRTPQKKFGRNVKAPKCIQSAKKSIKDSTEPFEDSALYPTTEPFFGFAQ